jgi:menaquinone-dependent protoporphyrinogen oxidase
MAKLLIVYGTTEGHTARIARRMADIVEELGHEVDLRDSKDLRDRRLEDRWDAILVGGSVHAGEHQSSLREFARRNRELLEARPSAFFSVSLTAAEPDEDSRRETRAAVDRFAVETGWRPDRVEPIAGALVYSQYNLFVRHIMKLIAKRHGRPTETSRDYDYTDWDAVEAFAREFAERLSASRSPPEPR